MQRKAGSCARREPFTRLVAEPKAILWDFDVDWRCHYAASVQIKGRNILSGGRREREFVPVGTFGRIIKPKILLPL